MRPKVVFKYFSPERVHVVRDLKLRFTQPIHLNDPTEFLPFVEETITENNAIKMSEDAFDEVDLRAIFESNFREVIQKLPERERRKLNVEQVKQALWESILEEKPLMRQAFTQKIGHMASHEWRDKLPSILNLFRNNFGVLCLSTTIDSELMWAHYGQSHFGFALEFDARNSFFDSLAADDTASGVQPVQYVMERARVQEFISESNVSDTFFFRKSIAWSYECEVRLIRPLKLATEVLSTSDQEIALFEFPPSMLTSVILGHRCSEETEAQLRFATTNQPELNHVQFRRAKFRRDEYRIEILD